MHRPRFPLSSSLLLTAGLLGGALAAAPAWAQDEPFVGPAPAPAPAPSLALRLSTLGLGGQVFMPLTPYFDARIVAQGFGTRFNRHLPGSTADIDFKAEPLSGGLLFDYRPFAGRFGLTGGALFQDNRVDGTVTCPQGCSFQRIQIIADGNNTARLDTTGSYRHRLAPFAGLTFDNNNRSTPGVTYGVELGALYQGKARSQIRASGQADVIDTTSGVAVRRNNVDFATDADVQSNVRSQRRNLQHDLSKGQFYPDLAFTLGYRY